MTKPLHIYVPKKGFFPLTVEIQSPTSDTGISMWTMEGAVFPSGENFESNICCMASNERLEDIFSVDFRASSDVKTFMQKNKMKKLSNEFVESFENPTKDLLETNGVSLGDDIFEKPK